MSKTVGETTTDYVLDLATTLPVVISDTDAVYLYGLDIIAEQLALRQGSGQAQRYYCVHDGLGSVRQLLDNTGQIGESYAYDPFGVPLVGNGVANPFRFTGEAWDAEVECCTCGLGTTSRRRGGLSPRIRGPEMCCGQGR